MVGTFLGLEASKSVSELRTGLPGTALCRPNAQMRPSLVGAYRQGFPAKGVRVLVSSLLEFPDFKLFGKSNLVAN